MTLKTIWFRMTAKRARELGQPTMASLGLRPVEIDLDALSPLARWIADHITATYVVDEYRDKIDITAIAGFSMAERDRRNGKSPEYVAAFSNAYGDDYAIKPVTEDVTFPIFGNTYNRPEAVIEQVAGELIRAGAVTLRASNGEEYAIA